MPSPAGRDAVEFLAGDDVEGGKDLESSSPRPLMSLLLISDSLRARFKLPVD